MNFMPKSSAGLSLEEKIQILMDERDIRNVIYRLCRAINLCDVELFKTCFFDDALDHHEPFFVATLPEMVEGFVERHAAMADNYLYSAQQVLIDLDGDVARVESYVSSSKLWHAKEAGGEGTVRLSGVRYLDRFERRQSEWRIAERWFITEYGCFVPVPVLKEPLGYLFPAGTSTRGAPTDSGLEPVRTARDGTDLSYRF